jgi:hypothetical protein
MTPSPHRGILYTHKSDFQTFDIGQLTENVYESEMDATPSPHHDIFYTHKSDFQTFEKWPFLKPPAGRPFLFQNNFPKSQNTLNTISFLL